MLFYVVYGQVDKETSLSASKYRVAGVPEELSLMGYGPEKSPEVLETFREGYLWEQLQETESALASQIAEQSHCLVIRGTFEDPPTLDYLRDTVGVTTHFLNSGGVAIYDPQMFRWWSPEAWEERVFAPAAPVPLNHSVILVSEDTGGTEWIHTRGMRKFGRPDISIHQVPEMHREAAIELCNRFIVIQAQGAIIPEGEEVRMEELPSGLTCHHRGHVDDPDFNNIHLEILHQLS